MKTFWVTCNIFSFPGLSCKRLIMRLQDFNATPYIHWPCMLYSLSTLFLGNSFIKHSCWAQALNRYTQQFAKMKTLWLGRPWSNVIKTHKQKIRRAGPLPGVHAIFSLLFLSFTTYMFLSKNLERVEENNQQNFNFPAKPLLCCCGLGLGTQGVKKAKLRQWLFRVI